LNKNTGAEMEEAIENMVLSTGMEISDEESEDICSTCSEGSRSATDIASEQIDS
jgi:hypothetical protein